jgi:hypothetical protein
MKNKLNEIRDRLEYSPTTGEFTWIDCASNNGKNGSIAGNINAYHGYNVIQVLGTRYTGHRLAVLFMTGDWPEDQVDHINGVRHDNRWSNLRECTNGQNSMNRPMKTPNQANRKGVTPHGTKFQARIQFEGKQEYVGTFDTIEEAGDARDARAIELFGEFEYNISQEKKND